MVHLFYFTKEIIVTHPSPKKWKHKNTPTQKKNNPTQPNQTKQTQQHKPRKACNEADQNQ